MGGLEFPDGKELMSPFVVIALARVTEVVVVSSPFVVIPLALINPEVMVSFKELVTPPNPGVSVPAVAEDIRFLSNTIVRSKLGKSLIP